MCIMYRELCCDMSCESVKSVVFCRWYSMLCSLAILLYLVPLRFVWLLCFNLLLLRHPLRSCELIVAVVN